jgi:hypothetical protein
MRSPSDWKAEIEKRAADVEAQKVRLRLAVLVLQDALRDETDGARLALSRLNPTN